ncbi:MAG: EamA family transporter [Deltaproteobacteria bacterium]|nr:EamA family transporter [Deltaproteobacteria bacterium]
MDQWYTFAVIALFLLGIQRFLYKVSAERKCNSAWTSFSFMGTVAFLSTVLFFALDETVQNIGFLLFIALANSLTFFIATMSNMEALKRIPAGVAYPIIRLNAAIVVIFSIFYFGDDLSLYQGMGVFLALGAVVILARDTGEKGGRGGNRRLGFLFMGISILAGALAAISSKFAALYANKMAFMAVSYTFATFLSFGFRKKAQTPDANRHHKDALLIGFFMGLINLGGFYCYLKALTTGPLSIITSITAMHFVIAIILSTLIYGEKLNRLRITGILLSMTSILLLRL